MESLYHLHPIFEFLLTVYFGFIIAPEFFGRFLLEKAPQFLKISEVKTVEFLDTVIKILNEPEVDFKKADSSFQEHEIGLSVIKLYRESREEVEKQIIVIKEKIQKDSVQIIKASQFLEKELHSEDEDSTRTTMTSSIDRAKSVLSINTRKCYDHVFPFCAFYCLVVLLINGCHWASQSEGNDPFLLRYVSLFNLCCLLFILSLVLTRRILNNFQLTKNRFSNFYRFRYSIIIMLLIGIFSFYYAPGRLDKYFLQFNENVFRGLTITSTIFISSLGLLFFGYDLSRRNSIKYFQVKYHNDLMEVRLGIKAAISEFYNMFDRSKKTFKDIQKAKART